MNYHKYGPKWFEEDECECDMECEEEEKECDCEGDKCNEPGMPGKLPGCMILAHAYVLWQCYENAFCPQEALMKGTLFPELWGVYRIPE